MAAVLLAALPACGASAPQSTPATDAGAATPSGFTTEIVVLGDVDPELILQPDPERVRVLRGIPPEEAERGVYVVDLVGAGDLSPGSRLAPIVRPFVDAGATLLVETAAPPVTLLAGVPAEMEIPEGAVRVDDVVVFAEPAVAEDVERRLRSGTQPAEAVQELVGPYPVLWSGPTPAPEGTGRTTIVALPDQIRFSVKLGDTDPQAAQAHVESELASGAPPGSPGKPWSGIFGDPEIRILGNLLIVTTKRVDVPGLFLRALIDQRQLTFLP